MLENRTYRALMRMLAQINPVDLADGWHLFSPTEQAVMFRLLSRQRAAQMFEELDLPEQERLLAALHEVDLKELLTDLEPAETSYITRQLPPKMVQRLMGFLKAEKRSEVQTILKYRPDSVGSLMHLRFVRLPPSMTASQALRQIQVTTRLRHIEETHLETLYVVDDGNVLLGGLSLKELLVAPRDMPVRELMRRPSYTLKPEMDREEAAKTFQRYNLESAPVVDEQGHLLGMVILRDVVEVIGEESTEDIQKLGGMAAFDLPYFRIPFFEMIKKRGVWLSVLFVGEMLTATAMRHYEDEIVKAVVLALFIPLIISSGGNSGSQAATLIVRAMALGEVKLSDWWRVVSKELASGFALGCILGILGFLRIYLWSQISPVYGEHYLGIAFSVAATLVLVVMWGTLMGSTLPMILQRLRLDPAVVSTPFVATLVDVTGLMIYFTVAAFFLRGTLL